MKFYITGTRRGLGKALVEKYGICDSLEDCDVFINCKHDGFQQVKMLYEAAEKGVSRIINIGSNSSDGNKNFIHPYAIEKAALDKANEQLFYNGIHTTIIKFGYIDTERVKQVKDLKMNVNYCTDVISWVLNQPHRIKDLTITP